MEIATKVQTIQHEMKCDKCNEGFLIATGLEKGMYCFEHQCTSCKTNFYLGKKYPFLSNEKDVELGIEK